jgi:hypothetical protein
MKELDRMATRAVIAASLSSMSSDAMRTLLAGDGAQRVGLGGSTRVIEIAGSSVFVKLLTLTDRELDAGPDDTRNLFGLPPWYQYGVGEGSTGFSAWREIAAHELASEWVVTGAHSAFPLLYHWRVLHPVPQIGPGENDIRRAVQFWEGAPRIEVRLRALAASNAVAAVFLEYVPFTLRGWLDHQLTATGQDVALVVATVERELLGAAEHMRAAGVVHFDAHLDNVLTTGEHLVVSDFGLATGHGFQLDDAEQQFLEHHADHDIAYCAAELTNAILRRVMTFPSAKVRNDWIRQCAQTGATDGVVDPLAATVRRHAATTALVNDFYFQLHNGHFQAQFPATELAAILPKSSR